MIRRFVTVLVAALALCSCAELQRLVPEDRVEFELAGRIAVRHGNEASSGNIAWRHAREADEMLITSPVGTTVARLVRDASGVVLSTAEGAEHRAEDAEALTERVLGYRIPLAGMSAWVRGRPGSVGAATEQRDPAGNLLVLEQEGWRIEYQERRADGLPLRMRLGYPGLELRLAVHTWKVAP